MNHEHGFMYFPEPEIDEKLFEAVRQTRGIIDYLRLGPRIWINTRTKYASSQEYAEGVNYGIYGLNDITLAILASSNQQTLPFQTLLFSPLISNDPRTFLTIENNTFRIVRTDEPPRIHLVDNQYTDPAIDNYHFIDTASEAALHKICNDKAATKQVLNKQGILTPRGIAINPESSDTAPFIAQMKFEGKEIVYKENYRSLGDTIAAYPGNMFQYLQRRVIDRLPEARSILLEERILAYQDPGLFHLLPSAELTPIDYNYRVLTTFDGTIIDAELRIKPGERFSPVNISKGATPARTDILRRQDLVQKVFATARNAARAITSEMGLLEHAPGILGLDLIVNPQGNVYTIEINSRNVGGISTLCKLDKKPLASVRDIMLPHYYRQYMEKQAA